MPQKIHGIHQMFLPNAGNYLLVADQRPELSCWAREKELQWLKTEE